MRMNILKTESNTGFKMNSELENIKQFFTERRKRCLSVKAIEIEAKLPAQVNN